MTKDELAKALFGDKYNYVEHYGIKGQQWGKRRFQNEDGSLTQAGMLRYLDNGNRKEDVGISNPGSSAQKKIDWFKNKYDSNGQLKPNSNYDKLSEKARMMLERKNSITNNQNASQENQKINRDKLSEKARNMLDQKNSSNKTQTNYNFSKDRITNKTSSANSNNAINNTDRFSEKAKRLASEAKNTESRTDTKTGKKSYLLNRTRFDNDGNFIGNSKMSKEEFTEFSKNMANRLATNEYGFKYRPGDNLNMDSFKESLGEMDINSNDYSEKELRDMQQIMYKAELEALTKSGRLAKTQKELDDARDAGYKKIEEERKANSQTIAKTDKVKNPANMSDKAKKMLENKANNSDSESSDGSSNLPRSRQRNVSGDGKGVSKREMVSPDWRKQYAKSIYDYYTKRDPNSTRDHLHVGNGNSRDNDYKVSLAEEAGVNTGLLTEKQFEKMKAQVDKIEEKQKQRARKVKSKDLVSSRYTASGRDKINKILGIR